MRRKPCLLRSTWPEEEEKNDLNGGARDAPPQKVTLLNRMEVRRRMHSIPLSKILVVSTERCGSTNFMKTLELTQNGKFWEHPLYYCWIFL